MVGRVDDVDDCLVCQYWERLGRGKLSFQQSAELGHNGPDRFGQGLFRLDKQLEWMNVHKGRHVHAARG